MADDWDSVSTPQAAAPANTWDSISSVVEPPASSGGFFKRVAAGFNHIPRDISDEFMEGVYTTLRAPGQIHGDGNRAPVGIDENLGPTMTRMLKEAGYTDDQAKDNTARIMRSMQRQQGINGLVMGPLQALVIGPATGVYRSLFSRPLEESGGPPKEVTETLTMAGLAALGIRSQMSRVKVASDGRVTIEPIGDDPTAGDFKNAARRFNEGPIIEGEFTEIEPQKQLPAPTKTDVAVVEQNLRRLWDEDGIHPAEAIRDAQSDPFLRDEIAAYHGSPHDFEAFSLDKIGTGEGAQSYGHGLYFAENPAVAETYAVPRTGGGMGFVGKLSDLPQANMYRVSINADRSRFLDWDKPLSEQSEFVRNALENHPDPMIAGTAAKWGDDIPAMLDRIGQRLADVEPGSAAYSIGVGKKEIAHALRDAGIPGIKYLDQGSRVAEDIDHINAEISELSRQRKAEADPGKLAEIDKQLDGLHDEANRLDTKKQTSNFVLFDDKLVEITHKNGKEIIKEVDAGQGAPPRSANLAPNALPRTYYPQATAAAPPAGQAQIGGPPPSQPPPPPPQGPPLAPMPPPRPPYFTYDDRGAFAKAFSAVVKGWQNTFQPELVSDAALQADPFFAQYKSASQNLKDQIVKNQEDNYQFWRKQSEADQLLYLRNIEAGRMPAQWAARADIHRQILQKAHQLEVQAGSRADYFENYFPHIFESPQQARNWVEGRTAQLGPTWFQKERTFATIREALDAGLRLLSTNPEFLITHRLFSSADMLERMNLLEHMHDMGLAIPVAKARAERAQRIEIAQRLGFPIDVTTIGRDLSAEGWSVVNAPGGRPNLPYPTPEGERQWFLAPDIQPLWQNAIDAKGLWGNEGAAGTTFRGWMSFKNVWVPIKLALSAFHPMHVLHINMTGHIVQAVREASRGEYGNALRELGDVLYDPIAAAVPKLTHEGRFAREAWLVPEDARTPLEKAVVQAMEEGGLVANISEQLKIDSQRKLEEAWDKEQWFRMAPQLVREAIRKLGAPVFEHWIPNLKVAAYLRELGSFASQHPEIMNDDVQRRVASRTIAKSIENRYGEMFYGSMFWNRTLKDIGIGSFISLGWNTGFVREFIGGVTGPLQRGVRSITRGPTQTEQTIYQAQSKLSYAMTYMGGAMLINGIITYASTGSDPEGMDWAFPRTGRNNPDGTPHRLTNMFYTRELPMVEKHIQNSGSVVGGVADTVYSKMVIGPIVELARNKDYYGNEIWSEGNPLYKRGVQAVQHIFGEQFNPMSVSGARQALKTGGGWDEAALAMLGFGPAPSYANKTATQNQIEHLFHKFVAPEARPQEMGVKAKERGDIRSGILMAQTRGDEAAVKAAAQQWFKAGGSRQGLSNILLHISPDISMFRALPEPAQAMVMNSATPEEAAKYKPYLKSDTANRVADLQIEAMAAAGAGDQATSERLAGEIQAVVSEAVHSGRITNLREFQNSVQQNMMFRLMPQAAAEKGDVARQRRLLMQPAN